jgi:uncharacterized RDD family membrane protein YckC
MERPMGSAIPDDVDPRVFRNAWRRWFAVGIDVLVLAVAQFFLMLEDRKGTPPVARLVVFLLVCFMALSYWIVLHARFGQTLGKWLMRVRLVALDLEPVTWLQAIVREAPWIALTIVQLIVGIVQLPHHGLDSKYAQAVLWMEPVAVAWVLADFITVLSNKRRRALHDFLARTVVVRVGKDRRVAKLQWATT